MKITRKNWSAVAGLISEYGLGSVESARSEKWEIVYSMSVAGMTYSMTADLANELFHKQKLPDTLYNTMLGLGTSAEHAG